MNMETDLELQRRESMRLRAEQQKWKWYVTAMLTLSVLAAIAGFASGRHSAAASESNAHANGSSQIAGSKSASDGAEIVLPVAEQLEEVAELEGLDGSKLELHKMALAIRSVSM